MLFLQINYYSYVLYTVKELEIVVMLSHWMALLC